MQHAWNKEKLERKNAGLADGKQVNVFHAHATQAYGGRRA
jgi:hypothetical protein